MGNIITDLGLCSDPAKIEAIVNYLDPQDKSELHRFLGMVKYLDKLVPGESKLTAPLRVLMKEDMLWQWNPKLSSAMNRIKDALISALTSAFYDVNKPMSIKTDASQNGLRWMSYHKRNTCADSWFQPMPLSLQRYQLNCKWQPGDT